MLADRGPRIGGLLSHVGLTRRPMTLMPARLGQRTCTRPPASWAFERADTVVRADPAHVRGIPGPASLLPQGERRSAVIDIGIRGLRLLLYGWPGRLQMSGEVPRVLVAMA